MKILEHAQIILEHIALRQSSPFITKGCCDIAPVSNEEPRIRSIAPPPAGVERRMGRKR